MVMTQAIELQLDAVKISFVRERHFRAFLPADEKGGGESIQDEWDVLAVLVERFNGTADQRIVRRKDGDFIRVRIYIDYTKMNVPIREYLIPIPSMVVGQLLELGHVEGTRRFGYTDQAELRITEHGVRALLGHTQVLLR
jgi:hypothetical protein